MRYLLKEAPRTKLMNIFDHSELCQRNVASRSIQFSSTTVKAQNEPFTADPSLADQK